MQPRHIWYKQRLDDCLKALKKVEEVENWKIFRENAYSIAVEIMYLTKEWDKYYNTILKD